MQHLQAFQTRKTISLPIAERYGWKLKRYCIVAQDRKYDAEIVSSALRAATDRLPTAGKLSEHEGNHGIGFQIIHFAEVAVVSPVFYWIWGSVLANVDQMRAQWSNPTKFDTGITEVIGCTWELEIINFEAQCWRETMLHENEEPEIRLHRYLEASLATAEKL